MGLKDQIEIAQAELECGHLISYHAPTGGCVLCLRAQLAEAEALLLETLPAVQSYARKHGRAAVAAGRRNDADHMSKHTAIEKSAWSLVDSIRAFLAGKEKRNEGR